MLRKLARNFVWLGYRPYAPAVLPLKRNIPSWQWATMTFSYGGMTILRWKSPFNWQYARPLTAPRVDASKSFTGLLCAWYQCRSTSLPLNLLHSSHGLSLLERSASMTRGTFSLSEQEAELQPTTKALHEGPISPLLSMPLSTSTPLLKGRNQSAAWTSGPLDGFCMAKCEPSGSFRSQRALVCWVYSTRDDHSGHVVSGWVLKLVISYLKNPIVMVMPWSTI